VNDEVAEIEPRSASPESDERPTTAKRRRFLPRFGLKSLFLFALVVSLLFGWIGRNAYRLRQDEAAIEALQRCGPGIVLGSEPLQWEVDTPLVEFHDSRAIGERARIVLGLSSRPRLRSARLYLDDPNDERLPPALQALKRFPEVGEIGLNGPAFGDETIPALADLRNLKALSLDETRVTGTGLAQLADSPNLRKVYVTSDHPPEDLAAGLASLKGLRIVGLSGDACLDRSEVAALASLPELEELSIWNATPSGEADLLSPLEKASSLTTLCLHSERTDVALGELPRLPNLRFLTLGGITDETLAKWPASAALEEAMFSAPVTFEAVVAFSAAHPDCKVAYAPWYPPMRYYRDGKALE
jgi:hypothetical protein